MRVQRQDIIDAAMALLDDGGVDGLTMRRLAAALRIQAPSLYWHFAGKQALLDAMADALLAEMVLPEEEMPWDAWLRAVATEFRRALKSRRDGARVFAGTFPAMDNVLRISDRIIAKLRAAGADERLAVRTLFTLQYFVLGFTIEEQAATPPPGGHGEGVGVDLMQVAQRLTAEQAARYPNAAIAVRLLASDDDDARFRFGLDRLIDGLKAVMPS